MEWLIRGSVWRTSSGRATDLGHFLGRTSDRALPRLEAEGVRVDFAFIDGFDTFDHTLVDFFCVDRLLNIGGVVVIDDANYPKRAESLPFHCHEPSVSGVPVSSLASGGGV